MHPTFHVSQFKKHVGVAPVQANLPIVNVHGTWGKEPIRILDRRMVKQGKAAVTEVLVEWANSFPEYTT